MNREKTRLVFHNCQGYGLQGKNSLVRIPEVIYQVNLRADTVYLIDEKGEIVCVILKDNEEYDDQKNLDRRLVNHKNGFEITWVDNGEKCEIRCMNNKRKVSEQNSSSGIKVWKSRKTLMTILTVVVFVVIACFFYFISTTS